MSVKYQPVPPADTENSGDRKVPEGTHGAFRDNIHLNAHEAMCPDEFGMGRDLLRRSEALSDAEVLASEANPDIMGAMPVRGSKTDYTTSKWTDRGLAPGATKAGE